MSAVQVVQLGRPAIRRRADRRRHVGRGIELEQRRRAHADRPVAIGRARVRAAAAPPRGRARPARRGSPRARRRSGPCRPARTPAPAPATAAALQPRQAGRRGHAHDRILGRRAARSATARRRPLRRRPARRAPPESRADRRPAASASSRGRARSASSVPSAVASAARTLQCGSGSRPESTVRNCRRRCAPGRSSAAARIAGQLGHQIDEQVGGAGRGAAVRAR